jgi:hypothetical protein
VETASVAIACCHCTLVLLYDYRCIYAFDLLAIVDVILMCLSWLLMLVVLLVSSVLLCYLQFLLPVLLVLVIVLLVDGRVAVWSVVPSPLTTEWWQHNVPSVTVGRKI